jgi:predicted nucleotidyltransferase
MDRQTVIATLKKHQAELQRKGVQHAALFGSVARGDSGPRSDMDIMIDLDPEARLGGHDYAGLKDFIAGLFDGPVDAVSRDGLKPYLKPAALTGAVYAF